MLTGKCAPASSIRAEHSLSLSLSRSVSRRSSGRSVGLLPDLFQHHHSQRSPHRQTSHYFASAPSSSRSVVPASFCPADRITLASHCIARHRIYHRILSLELSTGYHPHQLRDHILSSSSSFLFPASAFVLPSPCPHPLRVAMPHLPPGPPPPNYNYNYPPPPPAHQVYRAAPPNEQPPPPTGSTVSNESHSDSQEPPTKVPRTRISRACENCRARRKKCQPPYPCKACRDAGLPDCLVRERARPTRLVTHLLSRADV